MRTSVLLRHFVGGDVRPQEVLPLQMVMFWLVVLLVAAPVTAAGVLMPSLAMCIPSGLVAGVAMRALLVWLKRFFVAALYLHYGAPDGGGDDEGDPLARPQRPTETNEARCN